MNKKTKKLNQQNNLLDKQIAKENQEIFTNMICYLRGANASEYEIESVRQDLTEMVISAQTRGEDISTLFNGDYKGFCDQVIENLPPRSWQQKLTGSLDMACWVLSILFLINIVISKSTIDLIGALVNKSEINWNISMTIGNMITILLIIVLANIIVQYIIKNSFKKELKHKKIVGGVIGTGLTLAFLGIALSRISLRTRIHPKQMLRLIVIILRIGTRKQGTRSAELSIMQRQNLSKIVFCLGVFFKSNLMQFRMNFNLSRWIFWVHFREIIWINLRKKPKKSKSILSEY